MSFAEDVEIQQEKDADDRKLIRRARKQCLDAFSLPFEKNAESAVLTLAAYSSIRHVKDCPTKKMILEMARCMNPGKDIV